MSKNRILGYLFSGDTEKLRADVRGQKEEFGRPYSLQVGVGSDGIHVSLRRGNLKYVTTTYLKVDYGFKGLASTLRMELKAMFA